MYIRVILFSLFIFSCDSSTANPDCTEETDCTGLCGGSAVEDDCGVCGGDNFNSQDISAGIFISNDSFIRHCDGSGIDYIVNFGCDPGNYLSWGECICSELFPDICLDDSCEIMTVCYSGDQPAGDYSGSCCTNMFENWWRYECLVPAVNDLDCECINDFYDQCGICGGDGTSCNCPSGIYDCAGICDGQSTLDCAGVCNGSTVEDCAGVCGGNDVYDCLDVCGGNAVLDQCGICNGDNSSCAGCGDSEACNYDPLSTINDLNLCQYSECNICDACDLSSNTIYLTFSDYNNWSTELLYNITNDIYGFQVDITGINITALQSDFLNSNNFNLIYQNGSTFSRILAYSPSNTFIPSGCGVLLNFDYEGDIESMQNIIFGGEFGAPINIVKHQCAD